MVSNAQESAEERRTMLSVKDVNIRYGKESALRNVSFDVLENEIFAIIGPANSGKTSFLRALNRMDDMTANMRVDGNIVFAGKNINDWRNIYALRRQIGVVFPLPVGLPMTIYDNVALAPRLRGVTNKDEINVIVERCLTRAALWDEVKDRLNFSAVFSRVGSSNV